jgi:hypothetical protein
MGSTVEVGIPCPFWTTEILQVGHRIPDHRVLSIVPTKTRRPTPIRDRQRPSHRMSSASATDSSFGCDPLMALFHEVDSARAAMTVARRAPLGTSSVVDVARTRLLRALEAFTAELEARNLPVPYPIRDDLRIQRRALGKVAGPRG